MIRGIVVISFLLCLAACHVGEQEDDALAKARTPHGAEVSIGLRPTEDERVIIGELLTVTDGTLLVEASGPHRLVVIPMSIVEEIGIADEPFSVSAAKAKTRNALSMKRLPKDDKRRERLMTSLRLVSRFPQGLNDALLQQLQDVLGVPLETLAESPPT